ncbi:uncharacterized protein LTR77_004746 [Saxophila tyrrhenica]|uniref:NADH:flavin oxidoreductase/NADH oxidase N-terminal domain-containing protein n=1 Tax=Saxophila tyrrhenica TaxID=1690608 RepID=A0AAV9PAV2_9PEZI|nr:hypothetical protein LTR77_004746 [Saxophila tyrrhenica]
MAPSARWPSTEADASPLGQPLKFEFSGRTTPNRFLKGAMTERISSWSPTDVKSRGVPSRELINLYRRWGEGNYGVILTGNVMIDPEHLEAAGNPIVPRDAPFEGERFERFKALATETKKGGGALLVAQVSHPGRQVSDRIQKNPISASAVQLEGEMMGMTFAKPREASQEDIDGVIDGFAHAAEYLEKAGFDGVELHGAHGYLLAQFISPTTNQRTDKYGGSLENRSRIIIEVANEIRRRTKPGFSVSIKLNSVEFQEAGLQTDEAREICSILETNGFDFVELSGGTYQKLAFDYDLIERESTKRREAFFMTFAEMIAPALSKTKVYVTGGFKTVGAMIESLQTVDGIGIARPACQEPRLPKDILSGKVKGAIKMQFDENDFGIQLIAAGTHMQQIGNDNEPVDLSSTENVEAFKKDMGVWAQRMGEDKEGRLQAYVDVTSVPAVPYGTAVAPLS